MEDVVRGIDLIPYHDDVIREIKEKQVNNVLIKIAQELQESDLGYDNFNNPSNLHWVVEYPGYLGDGVKEDVLAYLKEKDWRTVSFPEPDKGVQLIILYKNG